MNNLFTITLLVLISSLSLPSFAGDQKGNGGIDVMTSSGELVPIETYIANHSRPIHSICDAPEVEIGIGNPRDWKQALNESLHAIYQKLPGAGEMILKGLQETEFYFLDLEAGDQLVFTDDDGRILQTMKTNGAVRIPGSTEVYLVTSHWRNYWEHRHPNFEYQKMLTRVYHESLLPFYNDKLGRGTYSLGKAVVELLRLSNVYPKEQGHVKSRFWDKPSDQVASLLNEMGLKAINIPNVNENFLVELIIISSRLQTIKKSDPANWQNMYAQWEKYRDEVISRSKGENRSMFYFILERAAITLWPKFSFYSYEQMNKELFSYLLTRENFIFVDNTWGSMYELKNYQMKYDALNPETVHVHSPSPLLYEWNIKLQSPPSLCSFR